MSESVCSRAFDLILQQISGKRKGIIGLGSGSTVAPLAAMLSGLPEGFRVVPTSRQALQLILEHCPERLQPLEALNERILITVDGADAVDLHRKLVIKGGGACHVQEKIVAEASDAYCIVINDTSKLQPDLSKVPVPIEVIPAAASILLKKHFSAAFPAPCSFSIRSCTGKGKAGPVVTDNGNLIIDACFEDNLFEDAGALEGKLKGFAGVVGTGVFLLPRGTIIFEGSQEAYTF